MTALATESDHLDAVLVVLSDGDAVPFTVQTANRVTALPNAYSVVGLELRAGGTFRGGRTGRRGYRVAVQCRGRTEEQAQAIREAADAALRGVGLVVDGHRTTPIAFESGQPIDDDANPGWYSGLLLYTYAY